MRHFDKLLSGAVVLAIVLGVADPEQLLADSDSALPTTLAGTVVDAEKQPVAGARVDITTAAPKVGRGIFCPSCYVDCRKWAMTDEQGRFELTKLDASLKFRVLVTTPGMKPIETGLLDPSIDEPEIQLQLQPTDWPTERTVRGTVVDMGGRPIAGALVEPCGGKTAEKRWGGTTDAEFAVTDREGNFAILVPANYLGLAVDITADGHSGTKSELLAPGAHHRIQVPVGAEVSARLVHKGRPMSGLRVAVVQTDRSARHHFIKSVTDVTDTHGHCRFQYLPPDEAYVIYSLLGGSAAARFAISSKEFHAPKDGSELDLGDIPVVPTLEFTGRITLPEDATLPPDARIIFDRDPAWDLAAAPIAADGSFAATGVPPDTYMLLLGPHELEFVDATPIPKYPSFDDRILMTITESKYDLTLKARIREDKSN